MALLSSKHEMWSLLVNDVEALIQLPPKTSLSLVLILGFTEVRPIEKLFVVFG